jgi:hypothetical protein
MNTLDPLCWIRNSCFGAFRTVLSPLECRCKTGRTCAINAEVRLTKLRGKITQRRHLIHSVGPKTHILGRSRPIRYYMNVGAKLAELAPLTHKFAEQSCVEICHNERT